MFVYVGGYTSPDRFGRGDGITVFRTAGPGQPWQRVQGLTTFENPSLLRMAPDGRTLYAVHGGRTRVSAYAVDPVHGTLSALGSQECGGENPVDLGFVAADTALVVACYTSGTVSVLPLAPGGGLLAASQVIAFRRAGMEAAESLPHGVNPDASGRFVLIPDKGLDCVFVFRVGPSGELTPADAAFAPCGSGSGPRHAVFHPRLPLLYVVAELDCSVQSFRWDGQTGRLDPWQTVSSLPPGAAPGSFAAEIAIAADGRCLYSSNRGHDSIAQFELDAEGGLGPALCTPCQGTEPRLFALAPGQPVLYVANQGSDAIVAFPLDGHGRLGRGVEVAQVGTPTAIAFGAP